MSLKYLSMSQLSEVTGLDRRTVKARLESVEPHTTHGKAIIYDSHYVLPLLLGIEKIENKNVEVLIRNENLRYEKARADKTELEVAKVRGEQVPIEDVAHIVEKEYSAVRSQLIAIPTKICLELSTIEDPAIIQNKLQDAINECLTELTADEKFNKREIPEIYKEETIDEKTSINQGTSSPS